MVEKRTIPSKCCTRQIFAMKTLLLVGIFIFLFSPSVQALIVPQLHGYVNDYANMISPTVKAKLEKKLRDIEKSDSTQIVILTIPSLDGEVIENFSMKVAKSWKIGQKGKDNGIIFIVAKQDRKWRIEVGRGLEGRLPNLAVSRINDVDILPKFRYGDFDGGFIAGTSSLIDAVRGAFKVEGPK